jgi:MarR family transcriptional regulator, organic hydroperoxide resistance regulator
MRLDNSSISNYFHLMDNETDIIISLMSRIREKANRLITAELSVRGLHSLKPIHGDLLLALFTCDRPTMKELADIVDRKKSTVTTLVDKLVHLGFAVKTKDSQDSRVFRVSLTPAGQSLKPDLIDISQKLIARVYKDMPLDERKQVVYILTQINNHW